MQLLTSECQEHGPQPFVLSLSLHCISAMASICFRASSARVKIVVMIVALFFGLVQAVRVRTLLTTTKLATFTFL